MREEGLPTLLVDGGNFAAGMGRDAWMKGGFVWDLMAGLGYDAATPGDHDLYEGLDSLRALAARHPEIQLVSANLLDLSGRHVLPESKIITRGKVRFGITAVIDSVYYWEDRNKNRIVVDDFRFEDMEQALQRVVPGLRAKSDVVVVLFHTQVATVSHLLSAVPGIDVAVAGHTPGFIQNPDKIGDAFLMRPGNRGQDLGILRLWLDPDSGGVARGEGEGKALDETIAMDQEIAARIEAWEKHRIELSKP